MNRLRHTPIIYKRGNMTIITNGVERLKQVNGKWIFEKVKYKAITHEQLIIFAKVVESIGRTVKA